MKNKGKERLNLLLSAFLILGYIVCAYFFTSLAATLPEVPASIVNILIFVVFGLLLFYATRVGDGKPVYRFSLFTLILVVLPALYVIIAYMVPNMPLNAQLHTFDSAYGVTIPFNSVVLILGSIALGYGVPYTFISGFEMIEEKDEIVDGGIKEELADEEKEETIE